MSAKDNTLVTMEDPQTRPLTLAVEVCLRHSSEINSSSSPPLAHSEATPHHGGNSNPHISAAIELYIRSNHSYLSQHSEVEFWDHSSDLEISSQMHEILLRGEMTLTKAELIISLYVKRIFVGQGGKSQGSTMASGTFEDAWKCLNGLVNEEGKSLDSGDGDAIFEDAFPVDKCQFQFVFYHCSVEEGLVEAFDGITLTSTNSIYGLEYITSTFTKETQNNIRCTLLPNTKFDDLWTSLHFNTEFKSQILGHTQLALALAPYKFNSMNNKLLILHGPPGSGKTTICKALAHKVSLHKRGMLIELSGPRIFSKWFGESAQKLETIFKDLESAISENPDIMFCILIDEVESLASSRAQIMNKNEATDAIRVVNTLLTQLDSLKPYHNFIIFSTSNLVSSLDEAFLDRADEVFEVSRPNVTATFNIIRQSLNTLINEGLVVGDAIPVLTDQASASDSTKLVYEISKLCHGRGLSGRSLTRLPLMTLAKHQIGSSAKLEPSDLPQFLCWLVKYVGLLSY